MPLYWIRFPRWTFARRWWIASEWWKEQITKVNPTAVHPIRSRSANRLDKYFRVLYLPIEVFNPFCFFFISLASWSDSLLFFSFFSLSLSLSRLVLSFRASWKSKRRSSLFPRQRWKCRFATSNITEMRVAIEFEINCLPADARLCYGQGRGKNIDAISIYVSRSRGK